MTTPNRAVKSSKSSSSAIFGDRMREFRLSLEAGDKGASALDRVAYNDGSDHRWRKLEKLHEFPGGSQQVLLEDMLRRIVDALEVPAKTLDVLLRYAAGQAELPWSKPPAWKPGKKELAEGAPPGRPPRTIVRDGKLLRVDESGEPVDPTPTPAPAPAIDVPDSELIAILDQVAAGALKPATALPFLRLVLAGQDLTHRSASGAGPSATRRSTGHQPGRQAGRQSHYRHPNAVDRGGSVDEIDDSLSDSHPKPSPKSLRNHLMNAVIAEMPNMTPELLGAVGRLLKTQRRRAVPEIDSRTKAK